MKSILLLGAVLFAGFSAHADMIKPATLDIVCNGAAGKQIRIISKSNGASISVNGTVVFSEPNQLIGGTEGGAPYLQAIGGGYNITVHGGDFQKAFYGSTAILNGTAQAHINDFQTNQMTEAACTGIYSFKE